MSIWPYGRFLCQSFISMCTNLSPFPVYNGSRPLTRVCAHFSWSARLVIRGVRMRTFSTSNLTPLVTISWPSNKTLCGSKTLRVTQSRASCLNGVAFPADCACAEKIVSRRPLDAYACALRADACVERPSA